MELKPQFQGLSAHEISVQLDVTSIKDDESGDGLGIKRDEETVTKIDSNPRSRAPVYEPISLENEADYFLSSAASKKGTCTRLGF